MAKTKLQKQEAVRDIEHKFKDSKLVVLTSYEKMPVSDISEVRKALNKENVSFLTVKKTLLKKTLADKVNQEDILINGNLSLAFGQDEVSAAKVIAKFSKNYENLKILGGWIEKNFVGKEKIEALSKLLSKEELLAKLLGTMKNPITGFVNVLSGNTRGLVNVLNAIKNQKTN